MNSDGEIYSVKGHIAGFDINEKTISSGEFGKADSVMMSAGDFAGQQTAKSDIL